MKNHLLFLALSAAITIPVLAEAETPAADKTQYTFLNPTPRELMREMSTDRPDKTESAYTVDAGHFQMEVDLLNASYDRDDSADTRTESLSIANANLKIGLCNSTDLQVVVPTYNWARTKNFSTGTTERNAGFGDLVVRLKNNFWGNDGGTTAFAAMPFVKIPSNQDGLGNKAWEGGIIFPLAVGLPAGWGMGVMTEVDFNEKSSGSGYAPEFVNTITFAHDIIGNLGGYVEFFSAVSTESGSDWVGTVDAGVSYAFTDDLLLDAGINIGITDSADDFNPFVGVSWRF